MYKTHSAKGFTMIELIVVLIIIGLLSTFGFTQYLRMIENGRKAEAKTNLGAIRTFAVAKGQELGTYPDNGAVNTELGLPTTACDPRYFYQYSIGTATPPAPVIITATRCTSGGKSPQNAVAYTLTLDTDGAISGSGTGGGW